MKPTAALALTLAINELATNAAKHGALSTLEGVVAIDWDVTGHQDARALSLVWSERGGPNVEAPPEHGFGLGLIERITGYELDGNVRYDFTPEGFVCELRLPYTADNFRGGRRRSAEEEVHPA